MNALAGRFIDRDIQSCSHLIHKIKATDSTGRYAYYFVLIRDSEREKAFLAALENTDAGLNLSEYGAVIQSCYGDAPSESVKRFLRERYQFDI